MTKSYEQVAPNHDETYQRLTALLIYEARDPQQIDEAANHLRRVERQSAAAERGRLLLGVPVAHERSHGAAAADSASSRSAMQAR
jgi:hypothetical protein